MRAFLRQGGGGLESRAAGAFQGRVCRDRRWATFEGCVLCFAEIVDGRPFKGGSLSGVEGTGGSGPPAGPQGMP